MFFDIYTKSQSDNVKVNLLTLLSKLDYLGVMWNIVYNDGTHQLTKRVSKVIMRSITIVNFIKLFSSSVTSRQITPKVFVSWLSNILGRGLLALRSVPDRCSTQLSLRNINLTRKNIQGQTLQLIQKDVSEKVITKVITSWTIFTTLSLSL